MPSPIRKQIRLPISVAFGIVLQGIRMRLGRSLVTLLGIVLGIAFLMSILTGQTIRRGVSQETATRVELKRRLSFLTAETGPLQNRELGVLQVGPLSDLESRFMATLVSEGVARFTWVGGGDRGRLTPAAAAKIQDADVSALGTDVSGIVVLGQGRVPADVNWDNILRRARQKVVAASRKAQFAAAGTGFNLVTLERELRPDEKDEIRKEEMKSRFRTVWIIVISLLVTVIGISNAMLMSVTERFREIGTMKCLGALSAFIRQMFFIESSLLGLVGSLAGSLFGFLFATAAFGLTYGLDLMLSSLHPVTLLGYFALSIVAGVVLSVVAAIYPATFASRMLPATALRSTI